MKFIDIFKLKKIAIYTTVVLLSSYFIVACDNYNQSNIVDKPAQISQELLPDFIQNSFNNFFTKYNSAQNYVTLSLKSFTPSSDNQQISMVISIAIANIVEPKILINSTFTITPEPLSSNGSGTVAKFILEDFVFVDDDTPINRKNSLSDFVKQIMNGIGLTDSGFVLASGDIQTELKSANTYDYVSTGDDFYYGTERFQVQPFVYNSQTKNNMALIDIHYNIPFFEINSYDYAISLRNLVAQELNHSFDDKFSYTGQNSYSIDSININNQNDINVILEKMNIDLKSNITDNGFVNQFMTMSFLGNTNNTTEQNFTFSVAGNMNIENINLDVLNNWSKYIRNPTYQFNPNDQVLTSLFQNGFSFSINDTEIEINGAKGYLNFACYALPINQSNSVNSNAIIMQMFNNIILKVDSVIPAKWLLSANIEQSQDRLNVMINQMIQNMNAMGFDGVITYDGEDINVRFELKKGNIFVDDELKGSLFNMFPLFM